MKTVISTLFFFTTIMCFPQARTNAEIITGKEGTGVCAGMAKETYIYNQNTSLIIQVDVLVEETNASDVQHTLTLNPLEKKRVGCSLSTSSYIKTFSITNENVLGMYTYQDNNVRSKIVDGHPFKVKLNGPKCEVDDGFTHGNDFLSVLKCFTDYYVKYVNKEWIYTGFEENIGKQLTKKQSGGDPNQNELKIFGLVLKFNEKGQVYNDRYGYVGNIIFEY